MILRASSAAQEPRPPFRRSPTPPQRGARPSQDGRRPTRPARASPAPPRPASDADGRAPEAVLPCRKCRGSERRPGGNGSGPAVARRPGGPLRLPARRRGLRGAGRLPPPSRSLLLRRRKVRGCRRRWRSRGGSGSHPESSAGPALAGGPGPTGGLRGLLREESPGALRRAGAALIRVAVVSEG